jgi:hypothetical protein
MKKIIRHKWFLLTLAILAFAASGCDKATVNVNSPKFKISTGNRYDTVYYADTYHIWSDGVIQITDSKTNKIIVIGGNFIIEEQ